MWRAHEISFQDANFPHRFSWRWSKLEGLHRRWIPYGMPRLNLHLERSVFFLFGRDPSGKTDKWVGPLGSGVIVGVHSWEPPVVWSFYAVTARHVIRSGAHAIRINTRDEKSRIIDLELDEWKSLPEEDVAVADITDRFQDGDLVSYVAARNLVSHGFMDAVQMNIGEDGFMMGLFTAHPGEEKNRIAARFGNVSLLADPDHPIRRKDEKTGDVYETPCHVFDIHSRPGYSGSPVFVYRTPENDLRDVENRTIGLRGVLRGQNRDPRGGQQEVEFFDETTRENRFLRLLGIHANQFHETVKLKRVGKGNVALSEDADDIKVGDKIRFPGSMTIVVPAWAIMRVIEMDDMLRGQREARWKAEKEAISASETSVAFETETAEVAAPEADNPSHKEDFMSLLGAAAKANKPVS